MSRSPSSECFNPEIHHSRRRPFALPNRHGKQLCGASAADEVSYPPLAIVRQLKKQTSSLWSPHLRRDRRVTRYSLWQPPSTAWASRVESPQQNNTQTVLFVLGFIFPLGKTVAFSIFDFFILTIFASVDGRVCTTLAARIKFWNEPERLQHKRSGPGERCDSYYNWSTEHTE